MTDYVHNFNWPRACLVCGDPNQSDFTVQGFSLLGGQTSETVRGIGTKRYLNHFHYLKGTSYICPNCKEEAFSHGETYAPRVKKLENIVTWLGIILIPVSFFSMYLLFTLPSTSPFASLNSALTVASSFLMVIFCTLSISQSEESSQIKRGGWATFYVNYRYRESFGIKKESLKFASPIFAAAFRSENPGVEVKVGRTYSPMPIKMPDWISCCIGCIPFLAIILFLSLLGVTG